MTTQNPQDLEGRIAVDSEGAKIGKIGQVYLDDQGGQPLWVTISTGMFGTKESFAPLYGSQSDGDSTPTAISAKKRTLPCMSTTPGTSATAPRPAASTKAARGRTWTGSPGWRAGTPPGQSPMTR